MDDRALTATTARGITACSDPVWMDWSKKVGLQESEIKTQLSSLPADQTSRRSCGHISQTWGDDAVAADVLGVSIGARGELTGKEQKRVDDFRRRCAFIDRRHLPRQQEQICKRAPAMSLLAYGWVCRFPPMRLMNVLATCMFGSKLRSAARLVKEIVDGGLAHPVVVLTCRLHGVIASMRASGDGFWNTTGHTPVALLKKQLYRLGWWVAGPFHWRHEENEIDLNQITEGTRRQLVKKACHEVRESYRAQCWWRFWHHSRRHEVQRARAEGVDCLPCPRKRAAVAREWSKDTMRAVVLQGAVVTPAAMRENYPRTCSECDEIGYHDHVYWCCPAVAEKLGRRPQEPEDWWQRRFGWFRARR